MTNAELDRANGTARGIRLCIYEGDTDSLLRYRENIPWPQLIGGGKFPELMGNAGLHLSMGERNAARAKADSALSVLLGWAERDGKDQAFSLHDNGCDFPEPVRSLIENGMTRSLVRFLDNGFDPTAKRGAESMDAFEFAQRMRQPQITMAMAAHAARGRAHDLIAKMTQPSPLRTAP